MKTNTPAQPQATGQAARTHNSIMPDRDIATIGAALYYSSRSSSKEDALVGDCKKAEQSLAALIRSYAALVAALEKSVEAMEMAGFDTMGGDTPATLDQARAALALAKS